VEELDRIGNFIDKLVVAFGPGGAALALLSAVLGWFYRRDIVKKWKDAETKNDILIKLVSDDMEIKTSLKDAIDNMSKSIDKAETQRDRNFKLLMEGLQNRRR